MQKECMRKLMSVVALLILAPAMDAAPISSEVPDLHQPPLRGKVSESFITLTEFSAVWLNALYRFSWFEHM